MIPGWSVASCVQSRPFSGSSRTVVEFTTAPIADDSRFLAPMKHDDILIRVYGNTVVLTGRSVGTFNYNGKVSEGPRRFTNVYVKKDGRWQLVAHQSTDTKKD